MSRRIKVMIDDDLVTVRQVPSLAAIASAILASGNGRRSPA